MGAEAGFGACTLPPWRSSASTPILQQQSKEVAQVGDNSKYQSISHGTRVPSLPSS
jgi:hypothetical protein